MNTKFVSFFLVISFLLGGCMTMPAGGQQRPPRDAKEQLEEAYRVYNANCSRNAQFVNGAIGAAVGAVAGRLLSQHGMGLGAVAGAAIVVGDQRMTCAQLSMRIQDIQAWINSQKLVQTTSCTEVWNPKTRKMEVREGACWRNTQQQRILQ